MTIIQKLVEVYKLWHEYLPNFSRPTRYTICEKIDNLFLEIIELVFTSIYAQDKERIINLTLANKKLDLIKFLLQMLWEIKLLTNNKYIRISKPIESLGKIIGAWKKQLLLKETPPTRTGRE
ncbi:MAG: four helix bundle protein [Patescibacteria group bacterium]